MSCSNCYNGCTQITSDQCVRYTGVDVPVLGIKSGDSLSFVEQALIEFLVSTLDGSGIIINLDPSVYCQIVTKYLPTCGDINASVLFEALVKAACDLQTQINTINGNITTLNTSVAKIEAQYKVECLDGVTSTSGTHDILQAVVTKLCAFIVDVEANYTTPQDVETIVQNYIANNVTTGNISERMVPYVAVPYFGAISGNFDTSGAGLAGTVWEKVYLCNGQNLTPDLRGRTLIGVTTGMGGGPMNTAVDPALGNPNYILNGINGSNFVTLDKNQMPLHSHPGSSINVELEESPHTHDIQYSQHPDRGSQGSSFGTVVGIEPNFVTNLPIRTGTTDPKLAGVSVKTQTSTVAPEGGNGSHPNFQPGIGCYYIMYIPS